MSDTADYQPPRRPRLLWAIAVVLGLLALTTIFIFVENSGSENQWERCKRELAARGEKIEWSDFIPPPIPAESNIYAAPKMSEWFVRKSGVSMAGHFAHSNTAKVFLTTNEATVYLDETDEDFSTDFQLVRTALKRPLARIDGDYSKAVVVSIPNFVALRSLAQMLAQRSRCDFLLNQSDEALKEITLMHDMSRLLHTQPDGRPFLLVTTMINVAITGLYADVIAEGFKANAWREPEIKILAAQLEEINLLPQFGAALRGERASCCQSLATMKPGEIIVGSRSSSLPEFFKDPIPVLAAHMPRSLVLQNMAVVARLEQAAIDACESSPGLVVPSGLEKANANLQRELSGDLKFSPSKWLASVCIPNFTRAEQSTARSQTKVNLARVACALELHRLAHGKYPEMLSALEPQFIGKLPVDLVGGQPLAYRRTSDEKFTLYSIGWNEKDDGGSVTLDWVWGDVSR